MLSSLFASLHILAVNTNYETNLPEVKADKSQIATFFQILFAVIGAVCLMIIIIGALRFVTAQGNPQETAKARSTVIYAVIGLVIVVAAEAIVAFAIGKL